ncbi:hypothetical protein C6P45_002452 [Maudiozyma exigua]|uniref:Uncharacterized protein n=1 Tax=Maudiozyma exigua TaxID=34358 RepID=A0A9P6VYK1_MAUEX|nr:hypothetical protein C6P45_002452 [Kazachstania exigua]
MDSADVRHIITLLKSQNSIKNGTVPAILNNLVYYIPRVQITSDLVNLCESFFESTILGDIDPLELFEAGRSIFKWKAQVSEPTIPLSRFFAIWNQCFMNCKAWTLPKIAIVCGILTLKDEYQVLQKSYFIDDSGHINSMFRSWREDLFMPLWIGLFKQSLDHHDDLTELLTVFYSTICERNDISKKTMEPLWTVMSYSCIQLLTKKVYEPYEIILKNKFYMENLNNLTKMLQYSMSKTDTECISNIFDDLIEISVNMAQREEDSSMPNKSYDNPFYSRKFIGLILTIRACLESRPKYVPVEWYRKTLVILFNLNFIAQDFGSVGFESYEFVQSVSIYGLIKDTPNKNMIFSLINTFQQFTNPGLKYPNKINDSRVIFLLEFLDGINKRSPQVDFKFLHETAWPIVSLYLTNRSQDIRENAHTAMLSLLLNTSNDIQSLQWKRNRLLEYSSMVINQYESGYLSKEQLHVIFETVGLCLPVIGDLDKDIVMTLLHLVYRAVINSSGKDHIISKELIKCLSYILPYCDPLHITDWLDNTSQLSQQSNLSKSDKEEIWQSMWLVISMMRNDEALKWWYLNAAAPDRCRL